MTETTTADNAQTYRCGSLSYTKRGLILLFAWMLWGDFCFTLMETVVPSILPLKLRALDSPNVVIGFILTTLPGIFNIGITPWLSFKSDRHRGSLGRRIPFILYTAPFLALSLVLIGCSDGIGAWVHRMFASGNTFSQAQVTIFLLAVFAAMFDFFNMFVNTVFWYLFNDVVPQKMMGRFVAWFRLVGTLTGAFYNFFIFRYAESHMREIYLGAAVLYLVGFGILCLKVREGEYPASEQGEREKRSWVESFRAYMKECFGIRYYLDIALMFTCMAMSSCIGVFGIFMSKSLGLDLNLIGKMGAIGAITVPFCFTFAGSLADRWNPVRVCAYMTCSAAFFAFGGWIWLAIDTPPLMVYAWTGVISGAVFGALANALSQCAWGAWQIILYPKERFGQFCGAVALIRAPAAIVGGTLAGLYVDIWKRFFPDNNYAYRFNFLWSGAMAVLVFYFHYRVYRAWKRLGGEKNYVAPTAPFKLADLPPNPEERTTVHKGILGVIALGFAGGVLSGLAYVVYYVFWAHETHGAVVMLTATGVNVVLFLAFVRFLKFMERP
jgi:maltose/moltooligosaccharide transporter